MGRKQGFSWVGGVWVRVNLSALRVDGKVDRSSYHGHLTRKKKCGGFSIGRRSLTVREGGVWVRLLITEREETIAQKSEGN